MKTLSTLIVLTLFFVTNANSTFGDSNLPDGRLKIPRNSILTLINGMSSTNTGLKTSCILTSGEYRVEEALETLINILNSDETDEVRIAVVFALYNIRTTRSISVLKSAAENDRSSMVKTVAKMFYCDFCRNNNFNIDDKEYIAVD